MLGPLVITSPRFRATLVNVRLCSGHFVKSSSSGSVAAWGKLVDKRESGSNRHAVQCAVHACDYKLSSGANNKWG